MFIFTTMDTVVQNGELSLASIEKDCWFRILNGSQHYKDIFHTPVVANRNEQGVNIRTVVLRKVDIQKKELSFHTDIRSGKWKELHLDNTTSWIFYDAAERIQVRLSGLASLHHDDAVAEEAWGNTTMNSRKIYSGVQGPSSITTAPVSGMLQNMETTDPAPEESETGRKNFGIVITKVSWMEWLWLNSAGHRRASFAYKKEDSFTATWLVP